MDSDILYIILGSIATILIIFFYQKWFNKKHPSYHKIDDGIVTVSIHRSRRGRIYYVHFQFQKTISAITGDIKTKITATIL